MVVHHDGEAAEEEEAEGEELACSECSLPSPMAFGEPPVRIQQGRMPRARERGALADGEDRPEDEGARVSSV